MLGRRRRGRGEGAQVDGVDVVMGGVESGAGGGDGVGLLNQSAEGGGGCYGCDFAGG